MEPKLIRHMEAVEHYSQSLNSLQGVWDNLALLGHLSGTGTDMTTTRQAFQRLSNDLLGNLSSESLKKTTLEMKAKAQVAVDIMVRNLYERTADIGFLASDDEIRRYLLDEPDLSRQANSFQDTAEQARQELGQRREGLRHRFREYVQKYSVYHNIILLDPQGKVVLQLDTDNPVEQSGDPLVQETLTTGSGYVETFRHSDLLPRERESLIYSYRVMDGQRALGILCLCFRFENETEGIFHNLIEAGDWTVLMLLDSQGKVIASSDPWHIPVGATLETTLDEQGRIVRFAGREYLSITRRTGGYQGYLGPGWLGHAMVPLQYAFDKDASSMLKGVHQDVLRDVRENPAIFSESLRNIPHQADKIQRELNRSVWNGNVRLGGTQSGNSAFSKVLLWEISNTGMKTKEVFEKSIANLHETVVSSILQDSRFLASLAVDIMDRNLYERANDCRWWALDTTLGTFLESKGEGQISPGAVTEILRHINSLYTVYTNIVLFDAAGRVAAVSSPEYQPLVGTTLGDDWARRTLALPNSASYTVSPFAPTGLYKHRHTYIYGAAVRSPDQKRVVGGIGIVFDSEPQFAAMLRDALPRDVNGEILPGCLGIFADAEQRVIAATDKYLPGERLALDAAFFSPPGEGMANIAALDGQYYAVGARACQGYREYPGVGAVALVLIPLGAVSQNKAKAPPPARPANQRRHAGGDTVDVATFSLGEHWYGLRSEHVAEAVDSQGLVKVPCVPPHVLGYVMWRSRPIVVVDIGQLLSPPFQTPGTDVVVVQEGDDKETFGILVTSLNEIPEIPRDRLDVVSSVLAGGQMLTDALVRPENTGDPILPVLSPARVRSRIAAVDLPKEDPSAADARKPGAGNMPRPSLVKPAV